MSRFAIAAALLVLAPSCGTDDPPAEAGTDDASSGSSSPGTSASDATSTVSGSSGATFTTDPSDSSDPSDPSDSSDPSSTDASTDPSSTDPTTTTEPESGTGLDFPPNHTPGSDARLVWSGADMLPRTAHTAIWQTRYVQQNGYYAVAWHTSNDGTWHASLFEYGTHPYPTTGTVDASGQSTGGTGSEGTEQYYEIAGLGASDFIASPGPGPTYPLVTDVWVTQARTAEIVGDEVRHRYWPDLDDPDAFIEQHASADGIEAAAAAAVSPAFTLGGSPWTGDGVSNGESPAAVLRGFALFSAPLDIDDLVEEANSESDTPVTTAGAASVWYINRNPTPDDIDDKSGAGHSPTWANDQRPGLWVAR